MHRHIIYPGAIPLETDLLNTNKYTMIALAKLASSIMGTSTYVNGLACTPTSPASMTVNIAAGEIYSLQNIDGTAYSSLAADTTHSILKQGYVLDAQSFTLTAPTTSGFSVNYLVQATYSDTDGGSTVLPYYNASNPSTAWSGPNNSGSAQYTVRQGICTVSLKSGVAATTGTQTTPSVDAGYIGLYVITVAYGASTVTAGNISTYANAPFLPSAGLIDGIQRNTLKYGVDTGVANAYVVRINPGLLSLSSGTEITFLAANANTGSSTLNVSGTGSYPVLSKYGQSLIAGEIAAGSLVKVGWSATASSWFLLEVTSAITTVATPAVGTTSTQAINAAFVSQNSSISGAIGRLIQSQIITSSTTFTWQAATKFLRIRGIAGGGGSGGTPATASTTSSAGQAGFYGQYIEVIIPVSALTAPVTVTIGAAGAAGASGGAQGGTGGVTSFGSIFSLGGGPGGLWLPASAGAAIIGPSRRTATITSTITPLGTSGGQTYSPRIMQAGLSINTDNSASQSPFPGGYYGMGGDGNTVGTSAAAQAGNAGVTGAMIIEEYA